jgi:hypothetical protein
MTAPAAQRTYRTGKLATLNGAPNTSNQPTRPRPTRSST